MTTTAEQDGTPGTIGVTIKYGKGYEDTWLNARGSVTEVRQMVIDYFGMKSEDVAGLTLSEIVTNATGLAHAKGNLGKGLGATVMNTGHDKPASRPAAAASQEEQADLLDEAIKREIDAAPSVEESKLVYGRNKVVIDSKPDLLTYWKQATRKLADAGK